jgi:5'-3' exonuclease
MNLAECSIFSLRSNSQTNNQTEPTGMAIENFNKNLLSMIKSSRYSYIHKLGSGNGSLSKLKQRFNSIYFDVNTMMYQNVFSEKNFLSNLMSQINSIIRSANVNGNIFLSVDGPASRAKFQLQRARRRCEEDEEENILMLDPFDQIHKRLAIERQRNKLKRFVIHPANFTSGTLFMSELENNMAASCYQMLQLKSLQANNIVLSGPNRPGEGEMKIFEYLRFFGDNHENHLIVGADSDIMLFSLQQKNKKLFVKKDDTVFDVSMLRLAIEENFPPFSKKELDRIIDDFCYLFLLSGNDYMPRLKYYSLTDAWSKYVEYKNAHRDEFLINIPDKAFSTHFTVNMKCLRNILKREESAVKVNDAHVFYQLLASYLRVGMPQFINELEEENYISRLHFPEVRVSSKYLNAIKSMKGLGTSRKTAQADLVRKIFESNILYNLMEEKFPGITMDTYLKILHKLREIPTKENNLSPEERREQIIRYFSATGFVLNLFRGICPDNSYYFRGDAPSTSEILNIESDILQIPIPRSNSQPLLPLAFCLAVMPFNHKDLVPVKELRSLMEPESPLADLYHGTTEELDLRWCEDSAFSRLQTEFAKQIAKISKTDIKGLEFEKNIKFRYKEGYNHVFPFSKGTQPSNLVLFSEKEPRPGSKYIISDPYSNSHLYSY